MDEDALKGEILAAEERFYASLRRLHEHGPEEVLDLWADDDRVTTMNAAGGHEQGRAAVEARWRWWASQGRPMPATHIERLSLVATPEMACSVVLERHEERVLRVTHVWVHRDGAWTLLHRHADPLVSRQG